MSDNSSLDNSQAAEVSQERRELSVGGITATQFANWRHHPVTKLFRKYLKDKQADLQAGALDWFLADELTEKLSAETRATILVYRTLGELKLADVHQFYAELETIEQRGRNAAETDDAEEED